jgi:TonB family protein
MATGVALLASCGQGSSDTETKTDTVVVNDTVTKTELVTIIAPVDSAAVFAYYAKAHAASKSTHKHAYKTKKSKQVVADSYEPVLHHDAEISSAPAATQPAAPDAKPVEVVVYDVQMYYFKPDERASFPGGEKAFDEYLNRHLEYPDEALDKVIEGTVYPLVYLDETGKVEKVEFHGDQLKYGFQKEARRVLEASPKWNPAKHAGKPVKSKFSIPITFDIK